MSSVDENNSFEKSALISDEYRNSEKRTNLEQQRMHTSSLQCSPSFKIVRSSIVDSINNTTIEKEFTNQESSDFINGGTTFHGNKSVRTGNSVRTGHILSFFCSLLNYYELPEFKKIKCKIKR